MYDLFFDKNKNIANLGIKEETRYSIFIFLSDRKKDKAGW